MDADAVPLSAPEVLVAGIIIKKARGEKIN